ncbi:NAD+ synthase [Jiella marina]|uniref:NAD+ synthase n=1 Tax=Jiella sp. LLJ827 TaxID=2917712 RepID=UPI002101CA36|nr:NAD+ synthase [Jiella sp. LLJ827]MCQ0988501.1 NAD+ synthase [Jiella sp. LLJ827]
MRQVSDRFRLALAQFNPTVGDLAGNLAEARAARREAAEAGADLILFTELFIAGYPPEDLILKPAFVTACMEAVEALAKDTADGGPGVLIGCPLQTEEGLFNAVALLDEGEVVTWRSKVDLPNYGEFDEKRVFTPGAMPGPVSFRGLRLGVPICEDVWGDLDVCETLAESGAEILLVPNGSPFYRGKLDIRHQTVLRQVIETDLPIVYANQIGGQDELLFDGASFAFHGDRSLAFQGPQFEAGVFVSEWQRSKEGWRCVDGKTATIPDDDAAVWQACVLGLRDYVNKNGFKSVVLGLSGGIDSAVCAALAVDALGPERVHTVMLPYRYTAETSLEDAAACAKALGIRYDTVPIAEPVEGFERALAPLFAGSPPGITEENLQSRTRGTILMAISNKFGAMVVTTGNKSEMSVGYATLYGDMNGGFNPIKDLYKTEVFRLASWRNANWPAGVLGPKGEVVPERIITKPPSAELRADQKDEDSLPPYDVLDAILEHLVEHDGGVEELVSRGFDAETVAHIERLLYIAEYKRRQSAPGTKVTRKNFGRDRRYPITNRFRDGA